MKKIFCFLLISLLFVNYLCAQTETKVCDRLKQLNNDTLLYLKQEVIAQKQSYIGKPLDSLLKDLPAPVVEYSTGMHPANRSFLSAKIYLYFVPALEIAKITGLPKKAFNITITWASPLNSNDLSAKGIEELYSGKWNSIAYNYFKEKIIGNIEMFEYDISGKEWKSE